MYAFLHPPHFLSFSRNILLVSSTQQTAVRWQQTQLPLSGLTLLSENETLPNSPRRRNGATKPQRNERNGNAIPAFVHKNTVKCNGKSLSNQSHLRLPSAIIRKVSGVNSWRSTCSCQGSADGDLKKLVWRVASVVKTKRTQESIIIICTCSRLQLKCDGTRWRREGKWRGNSRMEWVASTPHTTLEHGVFSITTITTADVHTSAAGIRLNWRPRRFKWTRPFRRKTKSGFCACAITFQLASKTLQEFGLENASSLATCLGAMMPSCIMAANSDINHIEMQSSAEVCNSNVRVCN